MKPTLTTYGSTGAAAATLNGLEAFNTATSKTIAATEIKYVGRDGTTYTESATAPTDAGKYTAKITVEGQTASVDYEIDKAQPTTPTGLTATYGQKLSEVTLPDGWTWADDTQSVGNVGSNTFKANFAGNNNYNEASNVDVTVNVSIADNPVTYTETQSVTKTFSTAAQTATLEAAENGVGELSYGITSQKKGEDTINYFTLDGTTLTLAANTPVGTYTVVVYARAAGNGNYYNGIKESTVTVTVNKADPTVTAPEAKTLTYTGSEQELVNSGSTTGGTLYYAVTTENTAPMDENLYTTSIPSKTDAGTYYVWYKVVGDANHNDTEAACVTSMIRGEISQTVTFKVVNGSWDDETTADKTVTLSGLEGDTLKLTADQIPAVGSKPNDTYKAGSWNVTPSTDTAITEAKTYTYTYAQKDSISQTVTFKVVNGSWDDGNTADITVTLTGSEGDTLKLAANQIPAVGSKPGDTYKVGSWDITPSTDTAITAATTYTYTYAAKEASVVTKAPEAKTLTYNGSAQELVTAGEATGGEMQYALGTATEATEAYTASIPTATDVGTYYVWYMVKGDATHTDSTPGCVEVTVRMLTVTFEVNGGSAVAAQGVASGATAVQPAAPTKSGYIFDGWYQDATCSVPFDFDTPITADVTIYAKWKPIVYNLTSVTGATNDANHVWYKQSGTDTVTNNNTGVVITVKLATEPDDSFAHFTGVQIDGTTLTPNSDYSVREGSTIVTIFPATLRRLSNGAHNVTVLFDNGRVDTRLTVRQNSSTPATGDQSNAALYLTILVLSTLGMAAVTVESKKRRSAKH